MASSAFDSLWALAWLCSIETHVVAVDKDVELQLGGLERLQAETAVASSL